VRLAAQIALLSVVVTVVTLLAWAAGAANLGTALGIGQVAFAAALVWLLLKR
jgi:hypothetical protein